MIRPAVWLEQINSHSSSEAALSPAEVERSRRIRAPLNRAQFNSARRLLRLVLADQLGLAPLAVPLRVHAGGWPELLFCDGSEESRRASQALRFSIAHSGDWVGVACFEQEIGLDLEASLSRSYDALARRYFHPQERAQMVGTPQWREKVFRKLWTCKEAAIKMRHGTLATHLSRCEIVSLAGGLASRQPGDAIEPDTLLLHHHLAGQGLDLAVAIPRSAGTSTCFEVGSHIVRSLPPGRDGPATLQILQQETVGNGARSR